MVPGDRLVCAFAQPRQLDDQFAAWPLHVTIIPWFRVALSTPTLAEQIELSLADFDPFIVTVGQETRFGYRRGTIVNLIRLPTPFIDVERAVRAYLRSADAWLVDDKTSRHLDYQPHVTVQARQRLHDGDQFVCQRLSIVEQRGSYKHIVGEALLHD